MLVRALCALRTARGRVRIASTAGGKPEMRCERGRRHASLPARAPRIPRPASVFALSAPYAGPPVSRDKGRAPVGRPGSFNLNSGKILSVHSDAKCRCRNTIWSRQNIFKTFLIFVTWVWSRLILLSLQNATQTLWNVAGMADACSLECIQGVANRQKFIWI